MTPNYRELATVSVTHEIVLAFLTTKLILTRGGPDTIVARWTVSCERAGARLMRPRITADIVYNSSSSGAKLTPLLLTIRMASKGMSAASNDPAFYWLTGICKVNKY